MDTASVHLRAPTGDYTGNYPLGSPPPEHGERSEDGDQTRPTTSHDLLVVRQAQKAAERAQRVAADLNRAAAPTPASRLSAVRYPLTHAVLGGAWTGSGRRSPVRAKASEAEVAGEDAGSEGMTEEGERKTPDREIEGGDGALPTPWVPELWHVRLARAERRLRRRRKALEAAFLPTAFAPSRDQVLGALEAVTDIYGPMGGVDEAVEFRECGCVDENGEDKPCVPPRPGIRCRRRALLVRPSFYTLQMVIDKDVEDRKEAVRRESARTHRPPPRPWTD